MELNNRITTATSVAKLAKTQNQQPSGNAMGVVSGQNLARDNFSLQTKQLSFKGMPGQKILESRILHPFRDKWGTQLANYGAKLAKNSDLSIWVGTLGALLISTPMPLFDKNAKKQDRIYSSAWMGGMSLAGLSTLMAVKQPAEKIAEKIATGLLKYNPANLLKQNFADDVAKNADNLIQSSGVMTALKNFPEVCKQIITNPTLNVDDYIKTKLENRQEAKGFIGATKNFFGKYFGKSKPAELAVEVFDEKVIGLLKDSKNKGVLDGLYANGQKLTKQILAHEGITKIVKFAIPMTACMVSTYLVSRYLGDALNYAFKKVTGKPFKEEDKSLESQKNIEKKKLTDKWLLPFIATVVTATVANVALFLKSNKQQSLVKMAGHELKLLGNTSKEILNKTILAEPLKNYLKLQKQRVQNFVSSEKGINKLSNVAVAKSWVSVNIGTDMVVRTLTNLNSPYNAFRQFLDNALKLVTIQASEKLIVNNGTNYAAKHIFGGTNAREGGRTIIDQGVKVIGICSLLMGFLNNAVSGRIMNALGKNFSKDKSENSEKKETNDQPSVKTANSTIQASTIKLNQSERISKLFETSKLKQHKA